MITPIKQSGSNNPSYKQLLSNTLNTNSQKNLMRQSSNFKNSESHGNIRGRRQINDMIEDNIKSISRLSNSSSLKRMRNSQPFFNESQEAAFQIPTRSSPHKKQNSPRYREVSPIERKIEQLLSHQPVNRITENDQEQLVSVPTDLKNEIQAQIRTISDFDRSHSSQIGTQKFKNLFNNTQNRSPLRSKSKSSSHKSQNSAKSGGSPKNHDPSPQKYLNSKSSQKSSALNNHSTV